MKRKLSNLGEQRVYDEIVGTVSSYRAEIYRKIRIADAIDISKLPQRSSGTYALQAHFDICVADENTEPAFVIEYDGAGHSGTKDDLKNDLARQAGIGLFRVSEQQTNRQLGGMTFLQYLVHTWFLGREFQRMQLAGEVSSDEPFMMSGFLKPDAKNIFDSDFDFLGVPRGRLNRLLRLAGNSYPEVAHMGLAIAVLGRDDSSFVSFASAPIGDRLVYGKARIDVGTPSLGPLENLPFGWSALSDFCEGMAAEDLCTNIEMHLGNGGHATLARHEVFADVRDLHAQGYRPLRGACGHDKELVDFAFKGPPQNAHGD